MERDRIVVSHVILLKFFVFFKRFCPKKVFFFKLLKVRCLNHRVNNTHFSNDPGSDCGLNSTLFRAGLSLDVTVSQPVALIDRRDSKFSLQHFYCRVPPIPPPGANNFPPSVRSPHLPSVLSPL